MLGQRISQLRSALGWSQVDLATRLNVAKQTVSNWENENILPSIEMLVRLTRVFGVSADYLLELDSIPRLSIEGLPSSVVAHIFQLIEDYRAIQNQNNCI